MRFKNILVQFRKLINNFLLNSALIPSTSPKLLINFKRLRSHFYKIRININFTNGLLLINIFVFFILMLEYSLRN
jgi:hypothetical protein